MLDSLSITFAPLIPVWLLWLAGLLGAAVVIWAVWLRARGWPWRAIFIAAAVLVLANPAFISEEREAIPDLVFVLLDESQSQNVEPRPEQSEEALSELLEELDALPDTEVRVLRAGATGPEGTAAGTQLFSALRQDMAEVSRQRISGIFMISDGQVHDVPTEFESLGIDAPVHLLRSGSGQERDRRVTVTQAPNFSIIGQPASLRLRVDDLPEAAVGGTVALRVRVDGRAPEFIDVTVGEEAEIPIVLERRGPSVVQVQVDALPDELSLANNAVAVVVNGVRERLRVLLVSGEPHSGERAWRNILKSDPSVDLVHFTILRPPEKQDGTPIRELSLIAFPTRELFEVKLDEFDLIIFDRYRRRGVLPGLYLENIARYVEEGGAVMQAAGPSFASPLSLSRTPLGRLLPAQPTGDVIEEGFKPNLTDTGWRHPVTTGLRGAPPEGTDIQPAWGRWFRQIETQSQSGDVLLSGVAERPLLILQRVGEGRVAQLLSDQIWLWSRHFEGGGPQSELVRRISHWLMKEPDLEEESLRAEVRQDSLHIERRSLSEAPVSVTVTGPDGETQDLELTPRSGGRATADLPIEDFGLYEVSDGTRTTLAAAGPLNPIEFRDLRATDALLEPVVAGSGGAFWHLAEGRDIAVRKVGAGRDRHGRDWLGIVGQDAYRVVGLRQFPVMPALLVALLTLGGLLIAWRRESA